MLSALTALGAVARRVRPASQQAMTVLTRLKSLKTLQWLKRYSRKPEHYLSRSIIPEGFDYARDAQAQAQDFDAMRDAEGGRLHADSLTGVPFAGGVTVMRNAAGRPMGPQTLAANLPFGAGTLARQIMTRNTLVEPDDRFGFSGPLSTGSPGDQPSFGNPDMDMFSGPSQNESVAAQQPPTPGVAGAPQAFGSPGPYDEYRARIGLGGIGVDPARAHNDQLMRAALGAR
jgi:hypothetical protein